MNFQRIAYLSVISLSSSLIVAGQAMAFTSPAPFAAIKNFQHAIGSEFAITGQNSGQLDQGSILVNSPKEIVLGTPNCKLIASPDAAIIATVIDNRTKLFGLCGDFNKPCKVIVGDETFYLRPGTEVDVISDSLERTKVIMNEDKEVERSIILSKAISDNLSVVQAEFSIPKMIIDNEMLVDVGQSKVASDQLLFAKILKTAALIEKNDNSKSPYREQNKTSSAPIELH